MAGNGFSIKCDLKKAKEQVKFVKSWGERLKKIEPMLGWLAADYIRSRVEARLPKSAETKTYRSAIEIARVTSMGGGGYGYAVQIDEKAPNVRKVDASQMLIYVQPARKTFRPDPEILILQKYSPWTLDTLPFKPDSKSAIVTTKKVKRMEVVRTTKMRLQDRTKWAHELQRVGVRPLARSQTLNFAGSGTLPNVALDALKMEFGLGKEKANPAWRLAIQNLAKQGFASFLRDRKNFITPLTNPSFSLWKKWPPQTKHSVSASQTKKFRNFQQKVSP